VNAEPYDAEPPLGCWKVDLDPLFPGQHRDFPEADR
jgi:hypothetical protein